MKNNFLVAFIGILGFGGIVYGAFSDPYLPIQGGTGTSTAPTYGQVLVGNAGGTYTLTATSSLGISASASYPFPLAGNATSTLTQFNGGLTAYASSTIGNGTDGLTVSGVATTTGNTYLASLGGGVHIGTTDIMTIHGSVISGLIQANLDGQSIYESHTHSNTATDAGVFYSARSRGTTVSPLVVQSGDYLGLRSAVGYDGTDYEAAGYSAFIVDGTPGGNDMPGRFIVATTPDGSFTPVERLRIDNAGNVGIGSTTPGSLLSIGGNGTGINFIDGTTATSTVSGNFHIKGNLRVDGGFYAPVTLVASGDTTINGALTVTGATTLATSLTGVLLGTSGVVSNASVQTCTNQFVRSMSASYVATCATVANTDLANSTISGVALGSNLAALTNDVTLSGSSYNGSGAISDWGLNLANPNTWTVLQQFSNASSTQLSVASETFYVDSTGHITAKDTVNAWSGVLSPTHRFMLPYATTTTMTATSSATEIAQMSSLDMDFAGIPRKVSCKSDGFVGIEVDKNGSPLSPSYFIASSTQGIINFTGSPTFAIGDTISIKTGTTTTDANFHYVRCTFDVTETP